MDIFSKCLLCLNTLQEAYQLLYSCRKMGKRQLGKGVKWIVLHTLHLCLHIHFKKYGFIWDSSLWDREWRWASFRNLAFWNLYNSCFSLKRATAYLIALEFFYVAILAMLVKVYFTVCLIHSFHLAYGFTIWLLLPSVGPVPAAWAPPGCLWESLITSSTKTTKSVVLQDLLWFMFTWNWRTLVCAHYFYFITSLLRPNSLLLPC